MIRLKFQGTFPIPRTSAIRFAFARATMSPLVCGSPGEHSTAVGCRFDFDGTPALALAEYGPKVVDRVNFNRGRVRPLLSVDRSLGGEIHKSDFLAMRMQFDAENLNSRLNVIDFGGLFSGNAIAPPRSYSVRLSASF